MVKKSPAELEQLTRDIMALRYGVEEPAFKPQPRVSVTVVAKYFKVKRDLVESLLAKYFYRLAHPKKRRNVDEALLAEFVSQPNLDAQAGLNLETRAQIFNRRYPGQQVTRHDLCVFMRRRGIKKKRVSLIKRNPRRMDDDKFFAQKRAIAHELFLLNAQGYEIW